MTGVRPVPLGPQPLVSFVTVVRNAADLIGPTIESVLGQTSSDFEYVVVDGVSTDGTLEIVRGYGPRIAQVHSARDRGIYDAMNTGLRLARGQWVNFMNAGDRLASADVLAALSPMLRGDHVVVAGAFEVEWPDVTCRLDARPLSAGHMPANHQATFVRADRAREVPFDIDLRVAADYDMMCRLLADNPAALGRTDVLVARVRALGFSRSNQMRALLEYGRVIRRHFGPVASARWLARAGTSTLLSAVGQRVLPAAQVRAIRRRRYGAR